MNILDEIVKRAEKYPQLEVKRENHQLTIAPKFENGFRIRIIDNNPQFTVSFEGWHEEFDNEEQALNCVAFGLTNECRLHVLSRGNFDYHWTVEWRKEDKWIADSETGLLIFPFWLKKRVRYLQNDVISAL